METKANRETPETAFAKQLLQIIKQQDKEIKSLKTELAKRRQEAQ